MLLNNAYHLQIWDGQTGSAMLVYTTLPVGVTLCSRMLWVAHCGFLWHAMQAPVGVTLCSRMLWVAHCGFLWHAMQAPVGVTWQFPVVVMQQVLVRCNMADVSQQIPAGAMRRFCKSWWKQDPWTTRLCKIRSSTKRRLSVRWKDLGHWVSAMLYHCLSIPVRSWPVTVVGMI